MNPKALWSLYLPKWGATMQVAWSNLLVYRLNFLLSAIAPLVVFLVVKLSLWYRVYEGAPSALVGGFTFSQMATYHLWVFLTSLLVFNGNATKISEDIRMGKITSYLIYPFSLWEFHGATFLARTLVQLGIAATTLTGVWAFLSGQVHFPEPHTLALGLLLTLMAAGFWFWANYLVGLIGFWMEETWTLMVMLQILAYFLSGSLIPLSFYPPWLQGLLNYTPFPAIAYLPARVLMGESAGVIQALWVLGFWNLGAALLAQLVWKKGLRLYTAAGM
ncbi:MAG: hypothetical protein A2600_03705 [Candidatus Lambdaproteobacteria bacterium RIFOXYD1_FULL_56_27]|uniref:ABC transporter permease n=1 Tax=Candidatus Lambdaproteobacteria bacterium RIFOXYD2_FULL_56_26 TaxID=1817773 RepID=A0A1F6H3A2_9PROT|nr:MAG: hypothetical protein A2426_11765 [Candidatus Lambdaproteobacteria bacterium RIFOXYC1_FULL_56_13]OGH04868.1 MAG: hypothetical protein A2557_07770 [Candidatus Lambdaproteobacteria bacterium RIFOXYD2_FULL_56_26]OGH09333.1 MAG: hypothetical protein A2600_03705 [Candidatus Lambdaproteobacteria bacterium RIFOXYD1_FULL_56_27]